ncbi:MAG: hypothetical protein LBU55_02755 [Elusimicrobiota bacterium]|jgi:hypothetical protein|nr:hypothetical protein [Elusimicrobiota bacterium]
MNIFFIKLKFIVVFVIALLLSVPVSNYFTPLFADVFDDDELSELMRIADEAFFLEQIEEERKLNKRMPGKSKKNNKTQTSNKKNLNTYQVDESMMERTDEDVYLDEIEMEQKPIKNKISSKRTKKTTEAYLDENTVVDYDNEGKDLAKKPDNYSEQLKKIRKLSNKNHANSSDDKTTLIEIQQMIQNTLEDNDKNNQERMRNTAKTNNVLDDGYDDIEAEKFENSKESKEFSLEAKESEEQRRKKEEKIRKAEKKMAEQIVKDEAKARKQRIMEVEENERQRKKEEEKIRKAEKKMAKQSLKEEAKAKKQRMTETEYNRNQREKEEEKIRKAEKDMGKQTLEEIIKSEKNKPNAKQKALKAEKEANKLKSLRSFSFMENQNNENQYIDDKSEYYGTTDNSDYSYSADGNGKTKDMSKTEEEANKLKSLRSFLVMENSQPDETPKSIKKKTYRGTNKTKKRSNLNNKKNKNSKIKKASARKSIKKNAKKRNAKTKKALPNNPNIEAKSNQNLTT